MTPGEILAMFERDLKANGRGLAPNGLHYVLGSDRLHPIFVRRIKRPTKGNVAYIEERIVGFAGQRFEKRQDAVAWAIADGRREYERGWSLTKRRLLA